jgi:hypothetical protein
MPFFKGKKPANLKANVWNGLKTKVSISEFGLKATGNGSYQYVFATEGFAISWEKCRKDNFPFPKFKHQFFADRSN